MFPGVEDAEKSNPPLLFGVEGAVLWVEPKLNEALAGWAAVVPPKAKLLVFPAFVVAAPNVLDPCPNVGVVVPKVAPVVDVPKVGVTLPKVVPKLPADVVATAPKLLLPWPKLGPEAPKVDPVVVLGGPNVVVPWPNEPVVPNALLEVVTVAPKPTLLWPNELAFVVPPNMPGPWPNVFAAVVAPKSFFTGNPDCVVAVPNIVVDCVVAVANPEPGTVPNELPLWATGCPKLTEPWFPNDGVPAPKLNPAVEATVDVALWPKDEAVPPNPGTDATVVATVPNAIIPEGGFCLNMEAWVVACCDGWVEAGPNCLKFNVDGVGLVPVENVMFVVVVWPNKEFGWGCTPNVAVAWGSIPNDVVDCGCSPKGGTDWVDPPDEVDATPKKPEGVNDFVVDGGATFVAKL